MTQNVTERRIVPLRPRGKFPAKWGLGAADSLGSLSASSLMRAEAKGAADYSVALYRAGGTLAGAGVVRGVGGAG
jgi:hypothetical protein